LDKLITKMPTIEDEPVTWFLRKHIDIVNDRMLHLRIRPCYTVVKCTLPLDEIFQTDLTGEQ
jgi:hypothetical protein